MKAFYKTETGQIVKVYDKGSDWRVSDGHTERWFSQWTDDREGSLVSAITRFLEEQFRPEKLVVC